MVSLFFLVEIRESYAIIQLRNLKLTEVVGMKQSLFSFLTSYVPTEKRESREDYLTQMFAWILINVEGYVNEYAKFLCDKNPDINCPSDSEINPSISTQEVAELIC